MTDEAPYEERHFHHGHARLEERDGQRVFICLPHTERTGYDLAVPDDVDNPWRWFAERGELGSEPWTERTCEAADEIARFGYIVDPIPGGAGWTIVVARMQPRGIAMGREIPGVYETREKGVLAALDHVREREASG
jgi:hypothetical protein